MSLVGTRPPTVDEWEQYELHHRSRMSTKPGITGMPRVRRIKLSKNLRFFFIRKSPLLVIVIIIGYIKNIA